MRGVPLHPVECRVCHQPKGCAADSLCHRCRLRSAPNPRSKYCWTPEQEALLTAIHQEAKNKRELSRGISRLVTLTGFPRYIVNLKAQQLRLTVDLRHPWTPADIEFLEERTGSLTIRQMARLLKRSYESVKSKIAAGFGGRYNGRHAVDGYSQGDVAAALGVPQQKVRRWLDRGLLREGGRGTSPDRIADAQVENFLRNHSDLYDLRRVDQVWFKSMLFPPSTASIGRPAASERAPEWTEAAC